MPIVAILSILAVGGAPILGALTHEPMVVRLFQWVMSVLLIGGMYMIFPVARVSWRAAWWGAVVAGSAFECSKWLFELYVSGGTAYAKVYGALAAIPIFIVWTYISWAIVLFGAHLARIVDGGLPKPAQPPPPERLATALAIEAARHYLAGKGPMATADASMRLGVPSDAVDAAARRLCAAGVLAEVERPDESMQVLLTRSPQDTPAIDVLIAARDSGSEDVGGSNLRNALTRMDAAAREATTDLTLAQLATRSASTVMLGPGKAPEPADASSPTGSDA